MYYYKWFVVCSHDDCGEEKIVTLVDSEMAWKYQQMKADDYKDLMKKLYQSDLWTACGKISFDAETTELLDKLTTDSFPLVIKGNVSYTRIYE